MKSRIAAVIAPMLLSMLVLVVPAHATFPGGNGKIVFASDRNVPASVHCDPRAVEGLFCADIWTMNADGSGLKKLTRGFDADWRP